MINTLFNSRKKLDFICCFEFVFVCLGQSRKPVYLQTQTHYSITCEKYKHNQITITLQRQQLSYGNLQCEVNKELSLHSLAVEIILARCESGEGV